MSDRARRWMVAAAALATTAGAADRPEGLFHKVAKTGDGVRIAMFRYAPATVDRQKPSVLLVSDFGFSSRAFDVQEQGLARYLASHGFETFSFDWRGSGASDSPTDFSIASLVEQDLPAVVDGTGAARLVIVGWGFGGTAAIAYAAHVRD